MSDPAVPPSAGADPLPGPRPPLRGLIVDWGGVLTPSLDEAMAQWARTDGVDFAHFRAVMRAWLGPRPDNGDPDPSDAGDPDSLDAGNPDRPAPGDMADAADAAYADAVDAVDAVAGPDAVADGGRRRPEGRDGIPAGSVAALEQAADSGPAGASPVHRLERGEVTPHEFERELARALADHGSPVDAPGLLGRLLRGLESLDPDMVSLVRRARATGLRTALLSNSWGDHYPEELWNGLFDAVVISGRVGMRKPDIEIFRHTSDLLGLATAECVMVDDLPHNVQGAVGAGMVGVLHRSYAETLLELEVLFDRALH